MGQAKQMFTQQRDEEQQIKQGLTINEKNFLTLDKQSVTEMAMAVVDKYTDGYNSAVDGLKISKKLIDLGEAIKSNISDHASNELKLIKGEKRIIGEATYTEQMLGVKYDFKPCGDQIYNKLKAKLTERENFLKTVTAPQITGDTDTGETWMVSPPVKSGKLGLVIKY